MVTEKIKEIYGNKIRVRVCGILKNENKILLLNHIGINSENIFWNFPGGGVENKESIEECLKREFLEETGLEISIERLFEIREFIKSPFHAIEFYFFVNSVSKDVILGSDPEHNILSEFRWFTKEEILLLPQNQKSSIFSNINAIF